MDFRIDALEKIKQESIKANLLSLYCCGGFYQDKAYEDCTQAVKKIQDWLYLV